MKVCIREKHGRYGIDELSPKRVQRSPLNTAGLADFAVCENADVEKNEYLNYLIDLLDEECGKIDEETIAWWREVDTNGDRTVEVFEKEQKLHGTKRRSLTERLKEKDLDHLIRKAPFDLSKETYEFLVELGIPVTKSQIKLFFLGFCEMKEKLKRTKKIYRIETELREWSGAEPLEHGYLIDFETSEVIAKPTANPWKSHWTKHSPKFFD
jgi:hypothetical protein